VTAVWVVLAAGLSAAVLVWVVGRVVSSTVLAVVEGVTPVWGVGTVGQEPVLPGGDAGSEEWLAGGEWEGLDPSDWPFGAPPVGVPLPIPGPDLAGEDMVFSDEDMA
jgi:hypothetical protein